MYADWTFYREQYRGERVDEAAFERVCARASAALDALTFGRIDAAYARCEDVRLACCAVCDVLVAQAEPCPMRERLDAYEIAWAEPAAVSRKKQVLEAARMYLWRTGLLSMAVNSGHKRCLWKR